jgi:ubiquinone/menaquinone biosynthesis C-methylase UbiE
MSYHERQRLDYDRIAAQYDADRFRSKVVDPDLVVYLEGRPGWGGQGLAALDVGCGTGNQLVADMEGFPQLRLVGLDLFHGMLREARSKTLHIGWVQGDGARLPFPSASFDYVTSQFSFHHVRDKATMLREVYRVLRSGGRFVMTNIEPRKMPGWAVYQTFPAAWRRDLVDFGARDEIARLLCESGFARVEISTDRSEQAIDLVEFARDVRLRVVSQVALLSEADYDEGVRQVEDALRQAGGRPVEIASELCLVKIVADKE